MNKFVWTKEYELGVGVIDEQHKHFFDIVNKIYGLLEDESIKDTDVRSVVIELMDYAYFHLATEEKYFAQFAYSDIANHMKYHTDFRIKSSEYLERINAGGADMPALLLEVDDFAKNWLSHHILVADKMYAPFFQAHGLK